MDKTLNLYVDTSDEFWKVWNHQYGMQVNIGQGGFALVGGPSGASISWCINGSYVSISTGLDRFSITLGNDVSWQNGSIGNYLQYYIKPLPLALVLIGAYYTHGATLPSLSDSLTNGIT